MKNPYYQGPKSDHFDGVRFFHSGVPSTDKTVSELLRWRSDGKAARWPSSVPVSPVKPEPRVAGLRITMVGHATLLIQVAKLNILTDPVWASHAGPLGRFGAKRVTVPGIAFEDLPPIDAILLSHNHYDHLDAAILPRLFATHDPLLITSLGNDTIVRRTAPNMRIVTGDWGDTITLNSEIEVTLTPAFHWSARGLRDRRMALWCGFVLQTPAGTVYFAGDTGYGDGTIFRKIGESFPSIDVALIPIGAYDPRWFMSAQHVDPEEALRIALDIKAKRTLGIHWGTFQLTDESRDEPAQRFHAVARSAGFTADECRAAESGGIYNFTD